MLPPATQFVKGNNLEGICVVNILLELITKIQIVTNKNLKI